jgi:Ras-related protein Rab-22
LKNWVEELRTQGPKEIAIAIAGNKADLVDRREVATAAAAAYANEIKAMFLETSAKDDLNVHDIFVQLSNKLPPPPEVDTGIIRATAAKQQQKEKSGCC